MRVDVALEWFLNPDHLPFLAGIEEGWFAAEGLEVELIVPDGHYDGLAEAEAGRVAFACNEPLHMLDAHRPGLRALGCFFETEGGVMLTPQGEVRLFSGQPIRIASPVAGGVTDAIAREILRRHAAARGTLAEAAAIAIEEAGFEHLANLKRGFDGAWLCFHNFEVVGAKAEGLPHVFVSTAAVGLPNFSALELFAGRAFAAREPGAAEAMQRVLTRAVGALQADPERARAIWLARSGEEDTPLLRAILADTLPRFVAPVAADAGRWRRLFETFSAMGFAAIGAAEYDALYG
ncbi:MAG: ABC transporter substrate-binding protein [Acetobacteraceae bacterium]|nr:ABC transporter substrate-binding protein [Acetobacteraceae bacterium]MDW8398668.1 ABC transporter substrate-binding protein [Acetobacteraceae bacterium]